MTDIPKTTDNFEMIDALNAEPRPEAGAVPAG
jgi:hypothetical protein